MKKVLINLVHPNMKESKINKQLLSEATKLDNVTINNLYEKYPDFKIDFEREQKLLIEHDVIIFQFPMYWLSSPALLKEWFDVTLTYGFAYGTEYNLKNKDFVVATTTGSSSKEFASTGNNEYEVAEFLRPFEGTAKYIQMKYKKEFVCYESFVISDEELDKRAKEYKQYIEELSK
ncbi:NAD(P)H-dependent oxidoreductase [Arcobacter sp. CECT 8985]|uniref:NAD(P)H-dependent oxidoreductase n=1 Tax=Arcobacter sp. CECT 8985 TaxID=1935424 RepID=UPI00100BF561|nr:NAD(P)H-dependent oxidoreductase [Arcobacter sp. CECT 8985]RXJ86500.1 general stress protein [Arcobacter sp. CECT 8985]